MRSTSVHYVMILFPIGCHPCELQYVGFENYFVFKENYDYCIFDMLRGLRVRVLHDYLLV